MVMTPSNMMPLGTKAPSFNLLEPASGQTRSLDELKSETATVVMFICNHCPFVIHIRDELVKFAKEYQAKNISFIAINSNDATQYPEDDPENMKQAVTQYGFTFPYLYDETQDIARAYDATCTPDFYVFDKDLKCIYRGQFDDARPGNDLSVSGHDLRIALDNIINGEPIEYNQKPSIGCNIKWK